MTRSGLASLGRGRDVVTAGEGTDVTMKVAA